MGNSVLTAMGLRTLSVVLFLSCVELGGSCKFLWGTATAAYQVEGHRNDSARQPSIWDCFDTDMHAANGVSCDSIRAVKPSGQPNIYNNQNAAVADNDYVNYNQTVAELTKFGFGAYRMSISWSRVMTYDPQTGIGKINPAGVDHYRRVLRELNSAGLDVALTMWHWDTPLVLENRAFKDQSCTVPGGHTGSFWLCDNAASYFEQYVQVLLDEFAPLIKFWITLNEPLTVIQNGYSGTSPHAPGRCSNRTLCFYGNDQVEPFHAAHNMLRAHAAAFRIWNTSTTKRADSICGITLNGDYALPLDHESPEDRAASDRFMEYQMGIFADPIFHGRWPASVVAGVGEGLPTLDPGVFGTHHGVYFQNHYTTTFTWASQKPTSSGYFSSANFSNSGISPSTGKPIGLPSSNGWLFNYPPGLALIQSWLHERYPVAKFVVTENGWGNASTSMAEDVEDIIRCNYYRGYIGGMATNAKKSGIDVLGYFAWSIMDNYEWADGFSTRFGMTYVDYDTQIRTPKLSMRWFKHVTALEQLPDDGDSLPTCESFLQK